MKKSSIEVSLESVSIKHCNRKSTHVAAVSLIYPRDGIACRTSEKRLELATGQQDWSAKSWCERILFKEQVEGNFGLIVEITESLVQAKLKAIGRYVLGGALRIGADVVDDAVPVAGGYMALPLEYYGKSLQKTADAAVEYRGTCDFNAAALPEGEVVIPLIVMRDILKTTKQDAAGGKAQITRGTVLARKGTVIGQIVLKIK